jgi:hypothetical protein
MGRNVKAGLFLLGFISLSLGVPSKGFFPQETNTGSVPEALRRPEKGEAPRYPQDLVIGAMGPGNAPEEAYRFAQDLLLALTKGNNGLPASIINGNILEEIGSLNPRGYRIGGGRVESDGSVSFLVRFLGPQESITGELFLRRTGTLEDPETGWLLDDLVLENKKSFAETKESYPFDFSPYERFF